MKIDYCAIIDNGRNWAVVICSHDGHLRSWSHSCNFHHDQYLPDNRDDADSEASVGGMSPMRSMKELTPDGPKSRPTSG